MGMELESESVNVNKSLYRLRKLLEIDTDINRTTFHIRFRSL